MIISRTPFRVSFFGGGTDHPAWYKENGGAVLSATIDKYCYLTCRFLPPFFEHRNRIVWSQIETVDDISDIQHLAVRETLRYLEIEDGVEIHHVGDLPARTGIGSSSSFVVGLLHALYALKGQMPSKRQLASEATHIERDRLGESVGSQDQISAATGGFNRIDFSGEAEARVSPMIFSNSRLELLQNHLMLIFTGISRTSSDIAREQIDSIKQNHVELNAMHAMVDDATNILTGSGDICDFGRLLHENWQLKRSLTSKISNTEIDLIYESARQAGAIGGKLLGAGGGGFMLLAAEPERQPSIRDALGSLLHVPFRFESSGSQIIFYDPK
jgi:D-glycero-alpha-D-manno-heptose-7-phosphate kinase